MIRTRALGRSFGAKRVLSGLDLELSPGERLALLGPNGSGKTTLLRILATLTAPSEGEAWLDGISVNHSPLRARSRLGFVPSTDGGFFPRFTGLENLLFFAELRGIGAKAARGSLERLSSLPPLRTALETPFHAASNGMKQCLGLARALLGEPPVLLLDEPTRSLDPETSREFRRFLREGLPGKTVLFVTHSSDEARDCGTRAVDLRDLMPHGELSP